MDLTRCSKCLMPTTRPDTEFKDGVCSACINFAQRDEVDWEARERDLVRLLEGARPVGGYDCIVPSSGGKDSHWQVIKLKELGANPLVVTAATCMQTEVGRKNIENLARIADTRIFEYDVSARTRLNVLGVDLVGDISWPEHVAIFSAPFRVAAQDGPKLIFYGECPQREYGGPLGSPTDRMTRSWIAEFGGHLGLRPKDMIGQMGLTAKDMEPYELPSDRAMQQIDARFLGAFYPWDSHHNAARAKAHGMIIPRQPPTAASWWPHENLDNAQTGLHDYFGYIKFGYGRLCAQLSVDIRNGRITRDEALEIVRARDGRFPSSYMGVSVEHVLQHLGCDFSWLMRAVDRFMNRALFARVERRRPILWEFNQVAA